jgi:hypothetical protein
MNRPRLWDATDALCFVARDILRNRQEGYPAAVESGKLSPDASADGLRIAAAIAADWTIAIELSNHFPEFAPQELAAPLDFTAQATPAERIATLEAVRAHPGVTGRPDYAEIVEALLWWERAPERGAIPINALNRFNGGGRAERQDKAAA